MSNPLDNFEVLKSAVRNPTLKPVSELLRGPNTIDINMSEKKRKALLKKLKAQAAKKKGKGK